MGYNTEMYTVLTSSLLDCFFLVSGSGLVAADIASCRRGEPWWCESVAVEGKWKVPDCERGMGIRDIYNKRVDVGLTRLFVHVWTQTWTLPGLEALPDKHPIPRRSGMGRFIMLTEAFAA